MLKENLSLRKKVPAIYGIDDSLIYFVDRYYETNFYQLVGFYPCIHPVN